MKLNEIGNTIVGLILFTLIWILLFKFCKFI